MKKHCVAEPWAEEVMILLSQHSFKEHFRSNDECPECKRSHASHLNASHLNEFAFRALSDQLVSPSDDNKVWRNYEKVDVMSSAIDSTSVDDRDPQG